MAVGKERKPMGLTTKIFIGLLCGLAVGVLFNIVVPKGYVRDDIFVNGIFYVVGQGFIRLMKMLVVPLVFASLVCGA
ncbi:MAG: cation:dicarboxylate symporter family transporter, partial [Lachnospiraceae bacterium]